MKGQLNKQLLGFIMLAIAIIMAYLLLTHGRDYAFKMQYWLFGPPSDDDDRAHYYFDRMAEFLESSAVTDDFSKKLPTEVPCLLSRYAYDEDKPLSSKYFFSVDYEGPADNQQGNKAYVLHMHVQTPSGFIDNASKRLGVQTFRYRCSAIEPKVNRPPVMLAQDAFLCGVNPPARYILLPDQHVAGMPFLQDYAQINKTTNTYYFSRYPSLYIFADTANPVEEDKYRSYFYVFDPADSMYKASSTRDSILRSLQEIPSCTFKKRKT
ncbi:MAG: hypothetical protein V1725_06255 [archaeon]